MSTNQYCENIAKSFRDGYDLWYKSGKKERPGDILQPISKHIYSVRDLPKIENFPISECIEATVEVPLHESLEEAKDDLLQALSKKLDSYVTYEGEIDPLKNNKTLVAKINIVKEVVKE